MGRNDDGPNPRQHIPYPILNILNGRPRRSSETCVAERCNAARAPEGFDFGKGNERAQRISCGKHIGKQRDRVISNYRIQQTESVQRLKRVSESR